MGILLWAGRRRVRAAHEHLIGAIFTGRAGVRRAMVTVTIGLTRRSRQCGSSLKRTEQEGAPIAQRAFSKEP